MRVDGQIHMAFGEELSHICQSIRTASMTKTAPNKVPPGMCSQKKAG